MEGYQSPYYTDVRSTNITENRLIQSLCQSHRHFQTAIRTFVDNVVFPDAQARESDGKPPSRYIFDEMARLNIIAMRLGPGKHLKGRVLMDGVVDPEEANVVHCSGVAAFLTLILSRSLTTFMN